MKFNRKRKTDTPGWLFYRLFNSIKTNTIKIIILRLACVWHKHIESNNNILTDMTVATAIYFESIKIKFVLFNLEISSVGMNVRMYVYLWKHNSYIFIVII